MSAIVAAFPAAVRDSVRRRADLEAELLALRHQVLVLQRQRGGAGPTQTICVSV